MKIMKKRNAHYVISEPTHARSRRAPKFSFVMYDPTEGWSTYEPSPVRVRIDQWSKSMSFYSVEDDDDEEVIALLYTTDDGDAVIYFDIYYDQGTCCKYFVWKNWGGSFNSIKDTARSLRKLYEFRASPGDHWGAKDFEEFARENLYGTWRGLHSVHYKGFLFEWGWGVADCCKGYLEKQGIKLR